MVIQEFIDTFLQPLLDKLSYENKNAILLSDFNIDLLHYDSHIQAREFLDKIYFGLSSQHITIPTRITPRSRASIDNIFTNIADYPDVLYFWSSSTVFYLPRAKCKRKYKINYKKGNKGKFEQDLEHINWVEALKVNDKNVANCLGNFLQIISYLLEKTCFI